jgi:hypothetical protein
VRAAKRFFIGGRKSWPIFHHVIVALVNCPMSYYCPTCAGELFVDDLPPRGGTPCPLCRLPLWYMRTPVDRGAVLTLLSEGKRRQAGLDIGDSVLSRLRPESALIVDLAFLDSISDGRMEFLTMLQRKLQSMGCRMVLQGVCAEVSKNLAQAGLETLVDTATGEPAHQSQKAPPAGEASGMPLTFSESSFNPLEGGINVPV